jgi:spore coat polysaccharide biosynthesis protein SpsF
LPNITVGRPKILEIEMIVAIIQARTSSCRLPAKVLAPILGKSMIVRQIERVKISKKVDKIVLATSTDSSDDGLAELCRGEGVEVARGSLNDVLDRFYMAAKSANAKTVVRLTGDCPLSDPGLIDQIVSVYSDMDVDYVSNTLVPTYPDGLDVEVFSFRALEKAWREATLPSDREHVTPYIKNQLTNSKFNVENNIDLSALRWTVDEPEDLELITRIFSILHPVNQDFGMTEILDVLKKKPEWSLLNKSIGRDEGYARSLLEDALYLQVQRSHSGED